MRSVQFRQLLYLKTVAETKSIHKASDVLFVSQQAISQALQSFEREYGVQLLQRSVHGVALTEIGEEVVQRATPILAQCDDLEAFLKDCTQKHAKRELRILAIRTYVEYLLPKAQVQFMLRYPEVSLEMHVAKQADILDAVVGRRADLGFLGLPAINGTPLVQIPPETTFTALYHLKYSILVGARSPLSNYASLSMKSVLQYPIIILQNQIENTLEDYLPYLVLSHYGTPQVLIAENPNLYTAFIRNNLGVGLGVNYEFDRPLPDSILIKPLRDNVSTQTGYLTLREHTPLVENFLAFL